MTVNKSLIRRAAALTVIGTLMMTLSCIYQVDRAVAAPTAPAAAPVFASVDMSKVIANYSKRASADAEFKTIQDQYSDVFKTQTANAMLGEDDQNKLGQLLLLGDSATPDQKQQIADLETQSGKDSDTLAALQQNKDATDTEKTQLQQLTQEQQAGQAALQDVADQYRQTLDQKNQDMSAQVAADIRVAVGEVAKAQGISVVFDNSVALYTSIDLTQSVISKLTASK